MVIDLARLLGDVTGAASTDAEANPLELLCSDGLLAQATARVSDDGSVKPCACVRTLSPIGQAGVHASRKQSHTTPEGGGVPTVCGRAIAATLIVAAHSPSLAASFAVKDTQ